jgi:hypothetical protein
MHTEIIVGSKVKAEFLTRELCIIKKIGIGRPTKNGKIGRHVVELKIGKPNDHIYRGH